MHTCMSTIMQQSTTNGCMYVAMCAQQHVFHLLQSSHLNSSGASAFTWWRANGWCRPKRCLKASMVSSWLANLAEQTAVIHSRAKQSLSMVNLRTKKGNYYQSRFFYRVEAKRRERQILGGVPFLLFLFNVYGRLVALITCPDGEASDRRKVGTS